jgi:hypothetical protein
MYLAPLRASAIFKQIAIIVLIAFAVCCMHAGWTRAARDEDIDELFEEVTSLRAQGAYDRAIENLNGILARYAGNDEVQRRAYNHLVWTLFTKEDEEAAIGKAREALERFPNLTVNTVEIPQRMNVIYAELRAVMYGSLTISKPESTYVYLDEEFVGATPISLEYVRAGEHELTAKKNGYQKYLERIRIDPSGRHSFEISLERERDTKWWLYRIGPAVLSAGIIAAILLSRDQGGGEPEPEPLPGPPGPPTN